MDIKIRSQSGAILTDCTQKDIKLGGKISELNQVVATDFSGTIPLGKYKDMDRAIEVIDAIQRCIETGFDKNSGGIMIIMPTD